jgi:hypothetical protein
VFIDLLTENINNNDLLIIITGVINTRMSVCLIH